LSKGRWVSQSRLSLYTLLAGGKKNHQKNWHSACYAYSKLHRGTVQSSPIKANQGWKNVRAKARDFPPSDFPHPLSPQIQAVSLQLDWVARASSSAAFGVPPKALRFQKTLVNTCGTKAFRVLYMGKEFP
jgi:hypothetical protein